MNAHPVFVYESYIAAPAERIWEALTAPEFTRRYFYATAVESDWRPGSKVIYRNTDGSEAVTGEVLVNEAPRRLVITWRPLYSAEFAAETPSRVSFEIEPLEGLCRLQITHDHFEPGSKVYENVRGGWSAIISSLKSLLETGNPLAVAGNEAEEAKA